MLLELDAAGVHWDDEGGHAAIALGGIGLREHDRPRGSTRVRDERLRAVQDVLVASALGGRLQLGHVGPCLGLREAEGAEDGLIEEWWQPPGLLFVGAGDDHRARPQGVCADRRADAGAAPVELFPDEDPVEGRELQPTEGLRHMQVHQSQLVCLGDHVRGVRLVLVVLGSLRSDLLLRELARQLPQRLLLVRERERDSRTDSVLDDRHAAASPRLTDWSIKV